MKRSGWAWIEVIVSVLIMVILVALLAPVIHRVRAQAASNSVLRSESVDERFLVRVSSHTTDPGIVHIQDTKTGRFYLGVYHCGLVELPAEEAKPERRLSVDEIIDRHQFEIESVTTAGNLGVEHPDGTQRDKPLPVRIFIVPADAEILTIPDDLPVDKGGMLRVVPLEPEDPPTGVSPE